MAALLARGAMIGVRGASAASKVSRAASLASKGSRAASTASRGSRTFSVAGKSGPVSKGTGFKPVKTIPKPKPKPKPGEKVPNNNPPGKGGTSVTDGLSTVAGAVPPPGGSGQSSSYGNMAAGLGSAGMAAAPGLASTGLTAGMGAAGAFAASASEGTSQEALERASGKGTRTGQNAADAVASGLAAATSGSTQSTVSGKTGDVVKTHEQLACPCDRNVNEFKNIQKGLSEGLKQIISQYYQVASRCKCKNDNEELANRLLKEILDSRNQLMSNGSTFGRSQLYKHIAMEAQNGRAAAAAAAGGTRKKTRYAMNKKSRTRKQQKTQFRRRTRKI